VRDIRQNFGHNLPFSERENLPVEWLHYSVSRRPARSEKNPDVGRDDVSSDPD
jgi:hypothetical protein